MKKVRVFAPASVANLAVGFDILGFAFDALGDRVTVERVDTPTIRIKNISGLVEDLPMQAELNTATVGLLKMREDLNLKFGFEVSIEKGIPKGSGLGGSAASAVASVLAASSLLDKALSREELLKYSLEGESIASGAKHADNIAPSLFGGLQLIQSLKPLNVISLPFPENIFCVLVHPNMLIETKEARKLLKKTITLEDHVMQSSCLAGFIAACYRNDLALLKSSLKDILIEPQRSSLIKGFADVKKAALEKGALGASISGSGPSIFALVSSKKMGLEVEKAMMGAFRDLKIEAQSWLGPISNLGAREIK